MTKAYVQALTLYQAGSGNIIGATTVVLTSLTDIYGNAITTMTPFGDTGYITLEPDTTNEEGAIFTGVTANANGTVSLTGVSTILAQTPYTATSGLVRQHSGGTKVVITDNVAFWNTFGNLANANTWATTQTFTVPPVSATNPTGSTQVANKAYVDGVAIAGGANASSTIKGISKLSIDPASGTNPIAVGDNDGRVPTQNENDALVGTSGTPVSSSNKLVDNADTGTSGVSKVLRLDGSGKLPALDGSNLTGVASFDYQPFTASGTWTKPTGVSANAIVVVQAWGAGGAGGGSTGTGSAGGGGGGAYQEWKFRASDLTSTVTVTVGGTTTGGAGSGSSGANTTFGAYLTAYGGGGGAVGASSQGGGGGGAGVKAAGTGSTTSTGGNGGGLIGGTSTIADSNFGGGFGGTQSGTGAGSSIYGGGGGAAPSGGTGGSSNYGGGGGGSSSSGVGGASTFGGAGGIASASSAGGAGVAPSGGGGGGNGAGFNGGNGARGEVRVWTI